MYTRNESGFINLTNAKLQDNGEGDNSRNNYYTRQSHHDDMLSNKNKDVNDVKYKKGHICTVFSANMQYFGWNSCFFFFFFILLSFIYFS